MDPAPTVARRVPVWAGLWCGPVRGATLRRMATTSIDTTSTDHLELGATVLTVVAEGYADLPVGMFAGGVEWERIAAALEHRRLARGTVRLPLNSLVLQHGRRLVGVARGGGA